LELGLWFSWNFYVLRNVAILFHSKYFGDIGLKPTASKQESKDKAAKMNLA
jgi:hypothetical protein